MSSAAFMFVKCAHWFSTLISGTSEIPFPASLSLHNVDLIRRQIICDEAASSSLVQSLWT